MVEMALVLPVFFMVVLGIVEFGRAMMVAQLVTNAAREGARIGVVKDNSNADIESFIEDFMAEAVGVGSGDVSIDITVTPAPGNTTSGNEVANAQSKDLVKVEVSVPFDKVSYIAGDYLNGKSLKAISTMRHE